MWQRVRVRVRVEDQLVLALFGFENMELAGVCVEPAGAIHILQCATLMVLLVFQERSGAVVLGP